MKKLKIAQVTPYYYPSIGGVAMVAKYISEGLVNRGHSVDIITARRDHNGRPKLNAPLFELINGVNIYRYKSIINISHISFFPSLIKHLMKKNYDIIHYHAYRHLLCDISAFIGKKKKSVTVLHGHGPFFEPGEINSKKQKIYNLYDKFLSKILFKNTDHIIALNEYEKQKFTELGFSEEKISIIPNAAESECFKDYDPKEFIKEHKIENKSILLFIGELNKSKRPDLLIKAFNIIQKKIPDAFLLVIGPDGGYLELVSQLIKEFNISHKVKYLGPKFGIEKQLAYSAAKLFVLPSDLEAFPLVLTEALAHGLPCVSTTARGPVSIIENGINGFIINKGDVDGMAEKITLLLSNTDLYNELSVNAKKTALEKYHISSVMNIIEEIYYSHLSKIKNV